MRTAVWAMSTMRRLGKDESGMTLGLAMVMILLIGVMGVGLLTFANKNLSTTLEVNRGQRAFEVADAGVNVAKRQLNSDCSTNTTCMDHYDDLNGGDYRWSPASGGVTLNDLNGDNDPQDFVHVTIDYRYPPKDDFKVVSTGNYGVAKRKIEAIFKGQSGSSGGSGLGLPTYYTPSSIRVENPLTLTGLSLFTERDILFNNSANHTTPTAFKNDVESNNSGYIQSNNSDELSHWDSVNWNASANLVANRGYWNTQPRYGGPFDTYQNPCRNGNNGSLNTCNRAGFAAVGKICDAPLTAATCGSNPSIADGVYGYDSTTGPDLAPLDSVTGYPARCPTAADPDNPKTSAPSYIGNKFTFCEKPQALIDARQQNAPNTISFPFPRPVPNAMKLRGFAQEHNTYFPNVPTQAELDAKYPGNENQVVFIDAQGGTVTFDAGDNNAANKGILVVWCGNLELKKKFTGVILNLYPNGSTNTVLPGGSTCTNNRGTVTSYGVDFSGWLYAMGGNSTTPGIRLRNRDTTPDRDPSMNTLPGGNFSFFNDLFSGGPPTSVQSQSWRELYE